MSNQELINKLESIIKDNISNEQFGVSQLADIAGMSRSTLLRKIQNNTGKTASKFIRSVRLQESKKLIKETQMTVSEISYKTGFNSTSYFIKCFKDEYGISPGEYNQKTDTEENNTNSIISTPRRNKSLIYKITGLILLVILSALIIWKSLLEPDKVSEKSIAVLPFTNNSNDSKNIYLVNGLMDAILNNLQKIKDLKVVSRTTVERYRDSRMTIPQIAEELDVSYFVEGSAQKAGDQIMLDVRLIDGKNDRQIWSGQYNRQLKDIFDIQSEVASKIAVQVEAKITPLEQRRIDEIPTTDMVAYDFFLQGLDLLHNANEKNLSNAIPLFTKAIERDTNFARAYAAIAFSYYYLDLFQVNKKHIDQVNYYAEKAYLINPQLPQSLVAKAFSYIIKGDYSTAASYFEKALEYHPNSAFVLNYLSDFYTNYIPNTQKYLKFALKGLQLDKSLNDSSENSYLYLHIANAFLQTGFLNEAEKYINKSLQFNPKNIYSKYVKAYIHYAQTDDLIKTRDELLEIYQLDTTRMDVLQEVAKTYYTLENYPEACYYYDKLLNIRKSQNIYLFIYEDIKIAWTYKQMGFTDKADSLIKEFKVYAENDKSIYHSLLMAEYYAYKGNNSKALLELKDFSKREGFHIWTLYLPREPFMKELSDDEEFQRIMEELNSKFYSRHDEIKTQLLEENLIIN